MALARLACPPVRPLRPLTLDAPAIRRLTLSLIAAKMERVTGRSVAPDVAAGWTDDTRLDEAGLGFDSLALLNLCAAVNEFFHLFESGVEDYLFVRRTLGEWLAIVARGLELGGRHLGFRSSGSTGEPKLCAHSMAALEAETCVLAGLFEGARRVVSLVPPHHIYGFLLTIGLPIALDCPVEDQRALAPAALARALQPGDVLVATPFLWNNLSRHWRMFPEGLTGLSSTAPMPGSLALALREAGLARLVEIYGSTETGGIGWREDHRSPFRLFAHLAFDADGERLWRHLPGAGREEIRLMDRIERMPDGAGFRPAGRLDQAVQIGGMNVFPARIAALIESLPGVAHCLVRPDTGASEDAATRLKAFVVPAEGQPIERLEQSIRAVLASRLQAAERPMRYTFGAELPRNAMGKNTDWRVADLW